MCDRRLRGSYQTYLQAHKQQHIQTGACRLRHTQISSLLPVNVDMGWQGYFLPFWTTKRVQQLPPKPLNMERLAVWGPFLRPS